MKSSGRGTGTDEAARRYQLQPFAHDVRGASARVYGPKTVIESVGYREFDRIVRESSGNAVQSLESLLIYRGGQSDKGGYSGPAPNARIGFNGKRQAPETPRKCFPKQKPRQIESLRRTEAR
jgi:hypothetical protein